MEILTKSTTSTNYSSVTPEKDNDLLTLINNNNISFQKTELIAEATNQLEKKIENMFPKNLTLISSTITSISMVWHIATTRAPTAVYRRLKVFPLEFKRS